MFVGPSRGLTSSLVVTWASSSSRADGQSFGPCSSPQSYTSLSAGQHTFAVRAGDAAGNTDATLSSYTWTIQSIVMISFKSVFG